MKGLAMLSALALLVAPAGAAQAQEDPVGVVVAGPTASGAELRAHSEGAGTCVRLVRDGRTLDRSCTEGATDDVLPVRDVQDSFSVYGGAVRDETAAVDSQDGDGLRRRSDAAPSAPFPGLRFFISERTGRGSPWLLRLLDARGTVHKALAVDDPPWVAGPLKLSSSRRSTLSGYVSQELVPLPNQPDRIVTWPCLRLMRPTYGDFDVPTVCRDSVPMLRPPADLQADVGRYTLNGRPVDLGHTEIFGLASPEVAAVEAVLGSGRRIRARPARVPGAMATDDGWVRLIVPAGEALRTVDVIGGARRLDRWELGWAPRTVTSGWMRNFGSAPQRIPEGARTVAEIPGGPALAARDADDDLCIVLAGNGGCGPPPYRPGGVIPATAQTREGGVISGVTSASVRRVVITPFNGPREPAGTPIELDTTPMPDYGGKWHSYLRVFIQAVPFGDFTVSYRDADGNEVGKGTVFISNVLPGEIEASFKPRFTLRPRGGRPVTIGHDRDSCLAVMRGRKVAAEVCPDSFAAVSVCSPRALVITARGFGWKVTTREGVRLPMRRVRISKGMDASVVAVPPRLHPTALVSGRTRHPLGRFPSSREQCGFDVEFDDS